MTRRNVTSGLDLVPGFEECWRPKETIDSGDLSELKVYRVAGFFDDWLKSGDADGGRKPLGRNVARKRIAKAVEGMLEEGCRMVTIQELDP